MSLEDKVVPYIKAIENGVEQKNWILSMMGSLTLIDICSSMSAEAERLTKTKEDEETKKTNGEKYGDWFDKYCTEYNVSFLVNSNQPTRFDKPDDFNIWLKSSERSKGVMKEKRHIYFNGLLAYALRCSFLHNGNGQVSEQPIHKKAVGNNTLGANDVVLDVSMESKVIEQIDDIIYLNPKHFCEAVIEGVYRWIEDNKNKISTIENSNRTIKIKIK